MSRFSKSSLFIFVARLNHKKNMLNIHLTGLLGARTFAQTQPHTDIHIYVIKVLLLCRAIEVRESLRAIIIIRNF